MNILKEARVKAGITQEKAASLIGVSKRTLIRWELNHALPELTHIPELSRVYNLPIEEICLNLTKKA